MTAVLTRFPGVAVTHDGEVLLRNGTRTWGYISPRRNYGPYLRCNVANSARLVHRLIAKTLVPNKNPEMLNVVHHRDHDIYHNASRNLQWVNRQLNNMMRERALGCYFDKKRKMWEAKITVKGQLYRLGFFKTFLEGHRTYKKFRNKKFNEILKELENEAESARTYTFI